MNEKTERKRMAKYAEQDNLAIQQAIRDCLASYPGRKFLWHLLTIGKIGIQPFTGNALNTSFACGELNVGQRILADIMDVNPMAYGQLMQEQIDEHRARTDTDTDSDTGADSYPDSDT